MLQHLLRAIFVSGTVLGLWHTLIGHLMRRVDSLEKALMLGGVGGEEKGTTEDEMAGWHH